MHDIELIKNFARTHLKLGKERQNFVLNMGSYLNKINNT